MEILQRHFYCNYQTPRVGRNCMAGTATGCGLDVAGIEPRSWQEFPHPSTRALRLTQPPVEWVPGPFHGLWCYHPAPFSAEVKESVAPYIYSPFGLSLPGLGKIHFFNQIPWRSYPLGRLVVRLIRKFTVFCEFVSSIRSLNPTKISYTFIQCFYFVRIPPSFFL
jgi:hypothetical protein